MATELHDKSYEGWDNFQEIKMQELKTLDFLPAIIHSCILTLSKIPCKPMVAKQYLGARHPLFRVPKQHFSHVPTVKGSQTVFLPCTHC